MDDSAELSVGLSAGQGSRIFAAKLNLEDVRSEIFYNGANLPLPPVYLGTINQAGSTANQMSISAVTR